MVACAVLGFALGAVVLLHFFYNYSRLKNIPGPTIGAVSDIWRANAQRSSRYRQHLPELHRKYGSVVRLGPDIVSLSDAECIAQVYRAQLIADTSRDQLPEQQDASRFEDAMDEAMRNLIRTIQRHRSLDLTMSLHLLADELTSQFFNAVTELNSQSRTQSNSSFFATIEELLLRGPISTLKRDRLSCYGLATGRSPTATANPNNPTHHTSPSDGQDSGPEPGFLNPVISASLEAMRQTLISTFYFLLTNPRVMHRLRSEIDNMPRSCDRTTTPSARDFIGVGYLDAVLNETLRVVLIYGGGTDIVLKTAVDIVSSSHAKSLILPRGTVVSWHPHVFLRDEAIFGNDPDGFRPTRWFDADRPRRDLMWASLLPLSLCLEEPNIEAVWMQLKKIVVVLLREFDDIQFISRDSGQARIWESYDLHPRSMLVEFRPRSTTRRNYVGQLV
ncbi:cytochrome P450 [Aspergillus oleicola]